MRSWSLMRSRNAYVLALACGLTLGWVLLAVQPASGDHIAIVVDEHGHKIYINTGEPPKSSALRNAGFRATGSPSHEITRLVARTASKHQVDPDLVHAIIQVESQYNPHAISRKGAMGLMQLVPETARKYGVRNIFDPEQNIEGGVNYLKHLMELFGGDLPLSLAAYNAGENSVLRYGGIPSFQETRNYVRRVTSLYGWDLKDVDRPNRKQLYKAAIRRYIDSEGVVHFSNVD